MTTAAVDARTWRRAAFALFAVAAGTNVPTPLLLIYRDTLDLEPDVLTAVFGCYALGLVPALAFAGPLSDRLGRRRVMLPAMVLAALTSLLLIGAASSLPVLFAGRVLQGAVSGAVFTVGSAWVAELSLVGGDGRRRPAGGRGDDGRLLDRPVRVRVAGGVRPAADDAAVPAARGARRRRAAGGAAASRRPSPWSPPSSGRRRGRWSSARTGSSC